MLLIVSNIEQWHINSLKYLLGTEKEDNKELKQFSE